MLSIGPINRWCILLALLTGCVQPQKSALQPTGISLWQELENYLFEQQHTGLQAEVLVEGKGSDALVTVQGDQLDLALLLNEILSQTDLPFLYDLCQPAGRVSLHLDRVPCAQALETILSQAGYRCVPQALGNQTVFLIADGGPAAPEAKNSAKVYKQYEPYEANLNSLKKNLLIGSGNQAALWPAGNQSGVAIGVSQESNRVFLTGPADDVQRTVQILQQTEQENPCVLLDCILIGLQEEEELDLYAKIDFSAGPITLSGLGNTIDQPFVAGSLPSSGLVNATVLGSADNPWSVEAQTPPLKALLLRREARRTARAQILVQSGQDAYLQIGRNGYLLISTLSEGQPTVDTQLIQAGSTLTLSPQVLPGGQIRVQWDVRFARFLQDNFTLVANVFSIASTNCVQVRSGEPIVMGGLSLGQTTSLNQGYAGFRNLPVVDYLTNASSRTARDRQLLLLLVPRIAKKGLHMKGIGRSVAIPLLDGAPGVLNSEDARRQ
jgi:hypothetical protein